MLKYKAQTDKTKESKAKQINTVCAAKDVSFEWAAA